jgi:glycosyltransferase involved in cell wall biosynthesis
VDPQSPQEIASAISFLFENPEQARKMGQLGKVAVLKTYNWEVEEKKLVDLYRELLE